MKEGLRLWHYTAGTYLNKIIESGAINLATIGIAKGEKPAVWVSANPIWEHTVTKMVKTSNGEIKFLTKEQMHEVSGLARIEVMTNDNYITWNKYKYKSGIPLEIYYDLEIKGIRNGAQPSEWYARFSRITINEWLAIQVWDGNKWQNSAH